MTTNRSLVLKSHPDATVLAENFEVVDLPMPEIGDGEFLTRNLYASLDPGVRKLLGADDGYIEPIPVGSPLGTLVLGEVIESRNDAFPVGALAYGTGAVQEYSAINTPMMRWVIDRSLSSDLQQYMGILGGIGMTACFGFLDVCKPKEGETVLVSTAAGAVGSLVGQLAKIKGCKVVGITGGPEKVASLTGEYGFDAGIDYRGKDSKQLAQAIRDAAPEGVDIYFDNVGGPQLDAALENMNWEGRISCCGMISEYDQAGRHQFQNLFQIVGKVLMIKGFLAFQWEDQYPAAQKEFAGWMEAGKIHLNLDIEDGLDNAAAGFLKLFSGANKGKMVVKIADL